MRRPTRGTRGDDLLKSGQPNEEKKAQKFGLKKSKQPRATFRGEGHDPQRKAS